MMNEKILITGLGAISALGLGCDETLCSFENEIINSSIPTLFESSIKKPVFQVKEIPEKWARYKMRTHSLALVAVYEALTDARLLDVDNLKIGVCLGTTVAAQLNDIEFYSEFKNFGKAPLDAAYRYLNGNLADFVANEFNLNGPKLTVVNACSSGTDAIGIAIAWLNANICDVVIAGGADELNKVPYLGFNSLGIYSDNSPKPFDAKRDGLNLGEGAGILILEKENVAKNRGIYSNLFCAGYATFADGYHLTAPRPDGSCLEKAIRKSVDEAKINFSDIAFVNAHGTSTMNNDFVEGRVLKKLFGDNLIFFSSKGYTGHTLGAAGGLEAVFCALALKKKWIPKSIGFENVDEKILIAPVSKKTTFSGKYSLSTSLAFGGNNSALIIGEN